VFMKDIVTQTLPLFTTKCYDVFVKCNRRVSANTAKAALYRDALHVTYHTDLETAPRSVREGLIELLCSKLFKKKWVSENVRAYHAYIQNVSLPDKTTCTVLRNVFNTNNNQFFGGLIDNCTIKWGRRSISKLASYNYNTDTITVSTIFKHANEQMLAYVVYHEMLHKWYGYKVGQRCTAHTKEFKQAEAKFPNSTIIEKQLKMFVQSQARRR